MKPIRVLIVDDSAVMRALLTSALAHQPDIQVVGVAVDANDARARIKEHEPDVVTLDVEMPGMDGLTFLERLMRLRPMPVVMCSTLTHRGADAALRALELGAVDVVGKPTEPTQGGMTDLGVELAAKIRIAAHARVRPLAPKSPVTRAAPVATCDAIIAIASSTGGPEALEAVLSRLPANCPPTIITQHMPGAFMQRFAERLTKVTGLPVSVAAEGAPLLPGRALLAPGDHHLGVARGPAGGFVAKLDSSPARGGHRPAADVMFEHLREIAARRTVAVILSGMGRDGAAGAKAIKDSGGAVVAQDEASCVVFGMPRAAYEAGAVSRLTPLAQIADEIIKTCAPKTAALNHGA